MDAFSESEDKRFKIGRRIFEIEANQGVLQFEKFLSKNNYQVEVTELGNYWQEAYKEHFKPWSYNGYNFIPEWEKFNQVKC